MLLPSIQFCSSVEVLSRKEGLSCRHNFANFGSHLADYDNSLVNKFKMPLVRGPQAVLEFLNDLWKLGTEWE
jgi:hypothetical protein